MELVIAIISLIWVIGLFSLQRIDSLISEFYAGLGYYLSIHEGVIDKIQLEVISLLPKPGIDSYIKSEIQSGKRIDGKFLENAQGFLSLSKKLKLALEAMLILITILTPVVYSIDFSHSSLLSHLDKSFGLYITLAMIAISSIVIEKILSHLSDANWPVRIAIRDTAK